MRQYYKFLDKLPEVPLEFQINAFTEVNDPKGEWYNPSTSEHKDRWFVDRDGNPGQSSSYRRNSLGEQFHTWVKENIATVYKDAGVGFTQFTGRPTLGGHTDRTRKYSLIYLLQPGGAKVMTRWYQDPEYPIWREGIVHVQDHSKLILLEELEIPVKKWICINAQCIHSVEGIQTQRISINISFDQDEFGLDEDHLLPNINNKI